ncbi:putative CBS domain-containing protein [Gammaproteobacteria bacterium]
MHISDILADKGGEVYSVHSGQGLIDGVTVMMEYNVGSVLVMDGERLAGILTNRHILFALREKRDIVTQYRVDDLMSADVISCSPEDSVDDALRKMNQHQIRHLPVIVEGQLRGIVSMGDLVKASNNACWFENRLLKRYIQTWPDDEHRGTGLKLVVNNTKSRQPPENPGVPAA